MTEPLSKPEKSALPRTAAPARLAVDRDGYVWRVYDDGTWSMAPSNPDNKPIPGPLIFYRPLRIQRHRVSYRYETRSLDIWRHGQNALYDLWRNVLLARRGVGLRPLWRRVLPGVLHGRRARHVRGSGSRDYDPHVGAQNRRGEYVPAIPLPFQGRRQQCSCGASFRTLKEYQGHYALEHILGYD